MPTHSAGAYEGVPEQHYNCYMYDPEAQTDDDSDDITSDDHDRKHQKPEDCEPQIEAVKAAAAAQTVAGHVAVAGLVAQDAGVGPLDCHNSTWTLTYDR